MKKFVTPDYSHCKDFPDVYEPAEDTFLLLDALEESQEAINNIRPTITLEVGSGSGVVTTFLAQVLVKPALHLCTDRNSQATKCTQLTAKTNEVNIDVIETDLIEGLLPALNHSVDVLVFNPPYVVTPSAEVTASNIARAWAGGTKGREVMDRFFPFVPLLLSNRGIFYLVVIKENDPHEIATLFKEMGFKYEVVICRRSGPEVLSIMKFWRLPR